MVPIGIVTKDRPAYLNATLRSLSGSSIDGSPVFVFDDGSVTYQGYIFLYGNEQTYIGPMPEFPTPPAELQLPNLNDCVSIRCLQGLVNVMRISEDSLGVWNASNFAINFMAATCKNADGFLLLQDDLLLKPDWFQQIQDAIVSLDYQNKQRHKRPGIISGVTVVHRQEYPPGVVPVGNVTAQLLYVTRPFYEDAIEFFSNRVDIRACYDSAICETARVHGYETYLIHPYIARHIGLVSGVRPGQRWEIYRQAPDVSGPFAWADKVRCFY